MDTLWPVGTGIWSRSLERHAGEGKWLQGCEIRLHIEMDTWSCCPPASLVRRRFRLHHQDAIIAHRGLPWFDSPWSLRPQCWPSHGRNGARI